MKSPLASCTGNQNAVILGGENSGETVLAGHGAGGPATAVAVVSDLLAIAQAGPPRTNSLMTKKYGLRGLQCKHYVRVPASAASLLARLLDEQGVGCERMLGSTLQETAAFVVASGHDAVAQKAATRIANTHAGAGTVICLPVIDA
jgi:homoserine dehydrogenase